MGKEVPGASQDTDAETPETDHSHSYIANPGLLGKKDVPCLPI